MTTPADVNPSQLEVLCAQFAREVGALIRELRESGVEIAATKSTLTDVVTEADQAAELRLAELIGKARPDDGILGEEGSSRASTTGVTWVIDPIDGTVNYLYGLPAYAVSVAATVEDRTAFHSGYRAIAAAVYNPATDEMFSAASELGARRNGASITVSDTGDLATSLVGTGFGYSEERRAEQAAVAQRVIPKVRDIRRFGSAAYDLCLLASGRLDAFYERGLQPWDYAGGALIAQEAGALVLGRDASTPPGEPLLVAAGPALAETLHSLVTA